MWGEIPRNNIFLASKIGWDMGPHNDWYHPDYMKIKMAIPHNLDMLVKNSLLSLFQEISVPIQQMVVNMMNKETQRI